MSVHGVRGPHDSFESRRLKMLLRPDRTHDGGETLEVCVFHDETVAFEERNHLALELHEGVDGEDEDRTRWTLRADVAATEEADQRFEHTSMITVL